MEKCNSAATPTLISSGGGLRILNMNMNAVQATAAVGAGNTANNTGAIQPGGNSGVGPNHPGPRQITPPRMIISPQVIGARPGQPGVEECQSEFSEFLTLNYKHSNLESEYDEKGSYDDVYKPSEQVDYSGEGRKTDIRNRENLEVADIGITEEEEEKNLLQDVESNENVQSASAVVLMAEESINRADDPSAHYSQEQELFSEQDSLIFPSVEHESDISSSKPLSTSDITFQSSSTPIGAQYQCVQAPAGQVKLLESISSSNVGGSTVTRVENSQGSAVPGTKYSSDFGSSSNAQFFDALGNDGSRTYDISKFDATAAVPGSIRNCDAVLRSSSESVGATRLVESINEFYGDIPGPYRTEHNPVMSRQSLIVSQSRPNAVRSNLNVNNMPLSSFQSKPPARESPESMCSSREVFSGHARHASSYIDANLFDGGNERRNEQSGMNLETVGTNRIADPHVESMISVTIPPTQAFHHASPAYQMSQSGGIDSKSSPPKCFTNDAQLQSQFMKYNEQNPIHPSRQNFIPTVIPNHESVSPKGVAIPPKSATGVGYPVVSMYQEFRYTTKAVGLLGNSSRLENPHQVQTARSAEIVKDTSHVAHLKNQSANLPHNSGLIRVAYNPTFPGHTVGSPENYIFQGSTSVARNAVPAGHIVISSRGNAFSPHSQIGNRGVAPPAVSHDANYPGIPRMNLQRPGMYQSKFSMQTQNPARRWIAPTHNHLNEAMPEKRDPEAHMVHVIRCNPNAGENINLGVPTNNPGVFSQSCRVYESPQNDSTSVRRRGIVDSSVAPQQSFPHIHYPHQSHHHMREIGANHPGIARTHSSIQGPSSKINSYGSTNVRDDYSGVHRPNLSGEGLRFHHHNSLSTSGTYPQYVQDRVQYHDQQSPQYYSGSHGYPINSSNVSTGDSISCSSSYSSGNSPSHHHNTIGNFNMGSQPYPLVCRVTPLRSRYDPPSSQSNSIYGPASQSIRSESFTPSQPPLHPYNSFYTSHPAAMLSSPSSMYANPQNSKSQPGGDPKFSDRHFLASGVKESLYLHESQFFDERSLLTQITLQALPGPLTGAQGHHLLVKTENGQYQLVRVGTSPSLQAPTQPPTAAVSACTNPTQNPSIPSQTMTPSLTTNINAAAHPSSTSGPNSVLSTAPIHSQTPSTITTISSSSLQQSALAGGNMTPTPNINITTNTGPQAIRNPVMALTMVAGGNSPRLPMNSNLVHTNTISSVSSNPAVCSTTNQSPVVPASSPLATATYRLQTVPTVPPTATSNSAVMGMSTTVQMQQPYQQQHPNQPNSATPQTPATTPTQASTVSQMNAETAKMKCKNFLSFLLELSAKQSAAVARNVKNLIQGLVDGKVNAEDFSDRLQKEVNSQPQPCLVGFLKKSLPHLRHSLATGELKIEGIKPPTLSSITPPLTTPVTALIPRNQVRPQAPSIPTMNANASSPAAIVSPAPIPRSTAAAVQQRFASASKSGSASARSGAGSKASSSASSSPAPGASASSSKSSSSSKANAKDKEKKGASAAAAASSFSGGDDDINDVAAMGGVNLAEESQRILGSTEFVGTQIRSCKDELFLPTVLLQARIKATAAKYGIDDASPDVVAMVSHATEERLKNLLEKLSVIAEHRLDVIKADERYEVSQDVKGQLRFLEELDKLERKRHDEQEREILIKAAKSRSKSEDPEQAKLKAKAKEMQRAALEEMRQEEANRTALQAIGPRKKPKLDSVSGSQSSSAQSTLGAQGVVSNLSRPQIGLRPRLKRVNLRDLLFLLEQDKETQRCHFLYKNFLLK